MGKDKCNICNGRRKEFDHAKVRDKYDIKYYRCEKCGFIQTEEPYWLEEAYSSAIADSDIGILQRNINISVLSAAVFKLCFKDTSKYLDWGGGYGIYTRLMRDKGFDFEWYDAYCENLFAKGHEKNGRYYDVITCYEVFEHIYNPKELLDNLVQTGNTIVFTTELNSFSSPNMVNEWWYYCIEHGQHISFYTKESLEILAKSYEKKYYSCGVLHILTDRKLNKALLELCKKFPRIINRIYRRNSLLNADYVLLTGMKE